MGGRAYELVDVAMREAGDKSRAIVRLRQLAGEWFQQGNADDAHALVANLIRWGEDNDAPSETISALKGDLSAIKAHKASAAYADDASAGQPEEKPEQRREQQKHDDGKNNHAPPARFNAGCLFLPVISAVAGFVLALLLSGFYADSSVQEPPAVAESPNRAEKHSPAIDNPPPPEKPAIKTEPPEEKITMHVSASGGVNIRATATATSGIVAKAGQFDDVIAVGKLRDGWQKVQVGDITGYIRGDLLGEGDGETARCESDVRRPANGEVFIQHGRGHHSIEVHAANNDTFAKLKNANGRTALSFFIRANQTAVVDNVADGAYLFQFTTGERFSVACGKFMHDARYGLDPEQNDFDAADGYGNLEYKLKPTLRGNLKTRAISEEEFLR